MIPLHKIVMAPLIGLLLLSSFWNISKNPKKSDLNFLWISLYFLVLVLGYFLSKDKILALAELENNTTFLLFPLIFTLSKIDFKAIYDKVVLYFLEGLILSVVISLVFSIIKFLYGEGVSSFFYGEVSAFHHTSYMAMYVSFGIGILYYNSFHPKKTTLTPSKWNFILITLLSIYVLLLLSKTGIIITLIIHLAFIFYWIIKHKKLILGLFSLVLICSVIVLSLSMSESVRSRFTETITSINSDEQTESSTGIRLISWDASWEIFMDHPILGTGTGDLNHSIRKKLIEKGHNSLALETLNSHNQYLTTLTKSGILGLCILIILFLIPVFKLGKEQGIIFLLFALVVGLNFLTESALQIQSGIIFIAFFITFFFSLLSNSKENKGLHTNSLRN